LLEVPEGRHKVATGRDPSQPRRGGTLGSPCAAPSGLGPLPSHLPTPTGSGWATFFRPWRDWARW